MNRSADVLDRAQALVPAFRMDARDRAQEKDAAERSKAEQELRDLRSASRVAQEQAAVKLFAEGLPAELIAERTKLPLKAVKALAKERGVKLPSRRAWL